MTDQRLAVDQHETDVRDHAATIISRPLQWDRSHALVQRNCLPGTSSVNLSFSIPKLHFSGLAPLSSPSTDVIEGSAGTALAAWRARSLHPFRFARGLLVVAGWGSAPGSADIVGGNDEMPSASCLSKEVKLES